MKKQKSIAERIEALRPECEAELTRLSEEGRPSSVPGPTIRAMWLNKAGGNLFEAVVLASKGAS